VGDAATPEDVDEEDGVLYPALFWRAAAAKSAGTTIVPFERDDRSTVPFEEIVEGFEARYTRLYITFSAIYGMDQFGIWLMSMFEPQFAAAGLLAVKLDEYVQETLVEGYWLARVGIMFDNDPGCW
jgi:hypothetical protein